MDGYQVAAKLKDYLEQALPKLELTIKDNFWDNTLWHSRITGCIAEVGVLSGFKIEAERRFLLNNVKDIDYKGFLEGYSALYNKYLESSWDRSSTDIDMTFLNPQDNSPFAFCEYENDWKEAAENVLKFRALHSFDNVRFNPQLCVIGFYGSSLNLVNAALDQVKQLISNGIGIENVTYQGKTYQFQPLKCHWFLFGLFKDSPNYMIRSKVQVLETDVLKLIEYKVRLVQKETIFLQYSG